MINTDVQVKYVVCVNSTIGVVGFLINVEITESVNDLSDCQFYCLILQPH